MGSALWQAYFYVYLENDVGLSGSEVGIIAAFQQMIAIFTLPAWGMLADRYGRKKIIIMTLMISAVLIQSFMHKGNTSYYIIFIILTTIFTSSYASLMDSIIIDFIRYYEKYSFGEIRLWASVGWATTTTISGNIFTHIPLTYIFPLAGIVMFSNAILMLFAFKPLPIKTLQVLDIKVVLRTISSNRFLVIFYLLMFAYGIASPPAFLYINVYMNAIGGTAAQLGYVFAIQAMSELPFFFLGKYIIQKAGARKTLLVSILITAFRYLLMSYIHNPAYILLLSLIHGFTFALFMISVTDIVQRLVPDNLRSTAQSLFYASFFGAGLAVGNFLFGHFKDTYGVHTVMRADFITALIVFSGLLLFFANARRKLKATTGNGRLN